MYRKTTLALALSLAISTLACAAQPAADNTAPSADAAAADSAGATQSAKELEAISVVGTGQARQVQRITSKNLDALPPGTNPQKVLNILPGVNAQSIDALSANEQSLTLSLRGFNSTRLGYTLDNMPLGDSAYNNYNGLSLPRALIAENLASAELAEGIGNIGTPSTSNLGGAISYKSSDPAKTPGARFTQTFGSDANRRSFVRLDTGEWNGFSAYLSGMYATSDLFVNQPAYNQSTTKQFNAKAVYAFEYGKLSAFVDTSRTSQADDFYLSKDGFARGLGWDWGGYAPNWQKALSRAYCNAGSLNAKLCDKSGPDQDADGAFTGGQILRNDDVYYVAGDFFPSTNVDLHAQVYHHEDKGAGNNWNSGSWSNFGTPQQLPLIVRTTLYTINRTGAQLSFGWDAGINRLEGGVWYEHNVSSASRYNYTDVTGPTSLDGFIGRQPDVGVFAQRTVWETRQAWLRDTIKLMDDRLTLDFGLKSPHATSSATALPGVAKKPILPTSNNQFATGKLSASKALLPQAGVRYELAEGQEVFAGYAKNIAMFQGGFKLGPQAVSQAVWDSQAGALKPEKSRTLEAGYRIVREDFQASAAVYDVNFDNRLLQYNPCDSRQPVGPNCGNRFYNVGGVSSHGLELTFLWTPSEHWRWYNSASFNRSTYDNDYVQGGVLQPTRGKIQVDTPQKMFSSELTWTDGPLFATLRGKYTGRRYYTYTNDRGFGGYTTFDLSAGYDFGAVSYAKDVRVMLNLTNLTDRRYAANLDSSVFAPVDPRGTIYVFHASAPRQIFGSIDVRF
ncbi:MAG: TonB-dependent receptor [Rudaea sp.]|uniref:TonB-dependent receptor n=1 Tax=unclassified Rudaea TaxID=2627037 RepID=UPI0010F693F7|nr:MULTISPECIES: TonB-dependent receptor [unclassified Rudaea]MBN8885371.1 TonB-dependent receptor [Rudaea sp.]MBR0345949.1 TonB-dependent receptor [Rudaea sp.]